MVTQHDKYVGDQGSFSPWCSAADTFPCRLAFTVDRRGFFMRFKSAWVSLSRSPWREKDGRREGVADTPKVKTEKSETMACPRLRAVKERPRPEDGRRKRTERDRGHLHEFPTSVLLPNEPLCRPLTSVPDFAGGFSRVIVIFSFDGLSVRLRA